MIFWRFNMIRGNKPLIIFGTSGAALEIYYIIKQCNNIETGCLYEILGFISESEENVGQTVCEDAKIIASDSTIENLLKKYDKLYGTIQFGNPQLKRKIVNKMKKHKNLEYPNIIHPSVLYEKDIVSMGEGNVIAAGSIIACNAVLGNFNLINRSCTIGHDFALGNQNTINPGSIISGNVNIGNHCLLGAGSIILEAKTICDNAVIGAGAVLTKSVDRAGIWTGIPARLGETIKENR